jgi:hypothetical protein
MTKAPEANKVVDCGGLDDRLPIRGLTGIDFLLMLVPALEVALSTAPANSTVRVTSIPLARLDAAISDVRFRNHLWINRRSAIGSQPGTMIVIATSAAAFSRARAEAWLRGEDAPLAAVAARGLIAGVQKCRGLLALAVSPPSEHFRLGLALPI